MSAIEHAETSVAASPAKVKVKDASGRLPFSKTLVFSLSSIPLGGLALTLGVYLPRYFASHIGVSLMAVGSTIGLIRIFDLFLDPALGMLMDRTRTIIGRYRPYMLLGAPILMLAIYKLFFAPVGIDRTYLFTWLLVCYCGVSLVTLSQASWGAALATNYGDRSRVYGWVAAMGVLGTIVVLGVPIALAHGGKSSQVQDVHAMGQLILVGAPISILLVAIGAPERVAPKSDNRGFRIGDYLELIKRPEMMRIIFADFIISFGPGTTAALYLFFFEDARGYTPAQTNLLLLFYIAAGLFGSVFWGWLGSKFQKHRTLLLSSVVYSVCQGVLMIIPHATMSLAIPAMAAVGFCGAAFVQLVRAMVADVADEVRLEQGRERAGLLYSMVTTTTKIGTALTVSITYTILGLVGYKAAEGAVNTPQAIHGLEACYVAAPIVFALVGAGAFIGYKLDAKRHSEIRAALEARDAAAAGASASV